MPSKIQSAIALMVCAWTLPISFGLAQDLSSAPSINAPTPAQSFDSSSDMESLGWWSPMVSQQMRNNSYPYQITLDELIMRAIKNSTQIKVFSELPMIRRTAIIEADAAFDWSRYLNTRWAVSYTHLTLPTILLV